MKENAIPFIVGSSIISTMISNFYIGKAVTAGSLPFEYIGIFLGIMFGISNIINVKLYKKYKNDLVPILVGAIVGLVFSLIGRFIYDLPVKIFDFTRDNEQTVHIYAVLLYAGIFRFVVHNLNKYLDIYE